MINKHKSNKIKENSNTVRHLNNGTDHRHSKSCCDQSSPARRTITVIGLRKLRNTSDVLCKICFNYKDVMALKRFPNYWPFVRGIHRLTLLHYHPSTEHRAQTRLTEFLAKIFSYIKLAGFCRESLEIGTNDLWHWIWQCSIRMGLRELIREVYFTPYLI